MKNYERYNKLDHTSYGKPGISDYFMKIPGDRVIFPFIKSIKEKNVLEVGLGSGEYTRYFMKHGCDVLGVDINPHLGKELGIEIIEASADNFNTRLPGISFDIVASFWMTEYLGGPELEGFFSEAHKVLENKGMFLTTIIASKGWGALYCAGARLKGIKKYGYSQKNIEAMLDKCGFSHIEILPITGRMGIIFAYLVVSYK